MKYSTFDFFDSTNAWMIDFLFFEEPSRGGALFLLQVLKGELALAFPSNSLEATGTRRLNTLSHTFF